jgi:hypothetical protein
MESLIVLHDFCAGGGLCACAVCLFYEEYGDVFVGCSADSDFEFG